MTAIFRNCFYYNSLFMIVIPNLGDPILVASLAAVDSVASWNISFNSFRSFLANLVLFIGMSCHNQAPQDSHCLCPLTM